MKSVFEEQMQVPVYLVVDEGIPESNRIQISEALQEFPSLEEPVLLSLESFLSTDNFLGADRNEKFGNALVVAVCHGALDVTDGNVSYFGMYNEYEFNQNITNIRDNCGYFWIAACWTGNIDVSTVNINYADILKRAEKGDFDVKIIHPFSYSTALSGIPHLRVITVSYLLGMLNLFKEIDELWYTRENHPIDFYSYSGNYASPINAQITCINKVYDFMANFDTANDRILFPNKLSFGEIFHCGVFVAHFPSDKLQVFADFDALEAYLVARPKDKDKKKAAQYSKEGRFKFLSSEVAESGNKWFKQIVEFTCTQENLLEISYIRN